MSDIKQDYSRLESTSMVSQLDVTFEDLVWVSDMVTSRSFAFPKQLGMRPATVCTITIIIITISRYQICVSQAQMYYYAVTLTLLSLSLSLSLSLPQHIQKQHAQ